MFDTDYEIMIGKEGSGRGNMAWRVFYLFQLNIYRNGKSRWIQEYFATNWVGKANRGVDYKL